MLKMTKQDRLAFALAEEVGTGQADALAAIRDAAIAASKTGEGKADAQAAHKAAGASLWPLVRDVAKVAEQAEGAAELDAATVGAVIKAVVLDALEGEPAAIKTIKAYTSTAVKAVKAVRAGTVRSWLTLEVGYSTDEVTGEVTEGPLSYEDARDVMRTDDQRKVKEAQQAVAKMVREIAGRDNGPRSAETRLKALESAADALLTLRNTAVTLDEGGKAKSKAAKAASELRQQQPSAPMQTEVSRAA